MKKLLFFGFLLIAAALMNAQRPIITKWNTNINNDNSKEIRIPATGVFTYTYVKSDDVSVTGNGIGNSGTTTITFPEVGEFVVSIIPDGTFKFNFSQGLVSNNKKLTELSQWGDVNWNTDLSGTFQSCSNLQITATDIPNFSNVTSMENMFGGCKVLATVPNMNSWDTSKVTNMEAVFFYADNFNENIGNWNTSMVTNMRVMFSGAKNFNQNIGNWDTSKVTDMNSMFRFTVNFNQDIGNWNTSQVTDMSLMFSETMGFNQNISNWDISKVTNMQYMVAYAKNFNQNLGNWKLNDNVNLQNMFDGSVMNCENYSKTLFGWAENSDTPNDRNLGAIGMKYGASGKIYRDKLTAKGWTILGDIFDSSCVQLAVEESKNHNFVIYPNPVKDLLHFSEEVSNIKITDVAVRTVKEISAKGKSVNISHLAKGVYIISAVAKSGETVTKKIVKE